MPQYLVNARRGNQTYTLAMAGASRKNLFKELVTNGWVPMDIHSLWRTQLPLHSIAGLFRAIAIQLELDIPLSEAIAEAANQKEIVAGKLMQSFSVMIQNGEPPATAFRLTFSFLPPLAALLFASSAHAGMLATGLEQIAEFLETEEKRNQEGQSLLFYPVVVLLAGIIASWAMLAFAVPRYAQMIESLQANSGSLIIPLARGVETLHLQSFWTLLGFIVLAILLGRYFGNLLLPPAKRYMRKWHRFAWLGIGWRFQMLSQLLRFDSRLPVHLELLAQIETDPVYRDCWATALTTVSTGGRFSDAIAQQAIPFPYQSLIRAAEKSGNLPGTFDRIGKFLVARDQWTFQQTIKIVEVVILLGLALFTATLVYLFFMPGLNFIAYAQGGG